MDRQSLEKTLVSIISFLSLAVFITPSLPAGLFSSLIFPHTFGKMIVAQLLIEIIFAVYLFLCFLNSRYHPRMSFVQRGKKRWNWVLASMSIFVLVTSIATLWSIDSYVSFWGTIGWNNGLITILHFYALFLSLNFLFTDKSFWLNFLKISFWIGLIVATYGALQYMGWFGLVASGGRATSTLGNPVYFGSYLIFPLFTSFYLVVVEKRLSWRWLYGLVGIFDLIVLIFGSDTRGAIVGVAGGVSIALLIYLLARLKPLWRKVALSVVVLLIIVSSGFLWGLVRSGAVYEKLERSSTVKTRLVSWGIAIDGWKERPWTGWGLENFNAPFEKYFDYDFYTPEEDGGLSEAGLDFPHNKVLEVGVSSGAIAVVFYLLIFLSSLVLIVQHYRIERGFDDLILAGLYSAYFIQNLFAFDSLVSYLMFFGFLALISRLYVGQRELGSRVLLRGRVTTSSVLLLTLVCLIVAMNLFTFRPLAANWWGGKSFDYYKNDDLASSIYALEKSESKNSTFVTDRLVTKLAQTVQSDLSRKTMITEGEVAYIEEITSRMDRLLERQPYKISNYILSSGLYLSLESQDPNNISRSISVGERALEIGGKRLQLYNNLGVAYFELGDTEKAFEEFNKSIELKPDYGLSYVLLAQAHQFSGNIDLALENFEKAFDLNYLRRQHLEVYSALAFEKKDWPRAIRGYNYLVKMVPSNKDFVNRLSEAYSKNGNQDLSRYVLDEYLR